MPTVIKDDYLCKDGVTWYRFALVELDSTGWHDWRIYILKQPPYLGYPEDAHSTHRYYDAELKRHYICWSEAITSLKSAKAIAKEWAERTERYRLFGETF